MAVDRIGDGLALRSKGDIVSHDGTANIVQTVGTDGQILTAQSSTPSGLQWVTPESGGAQYYSFIASATATALVTSIEITSITGSYTDLQVYISGQVSTTLSGAARALYLTVNGSSNTVYDTALIYSTGAMTTWAAFQYNSQTTGFYVQQAPGRATSNDLVFCSDVYIKNYSSTTENKQFSMISSSISTNSVSDTGRGMMLSEGRFASTSAITSLKFELSSASGISPGTSFIVYGIKRYGL
jgi:hypothetical protein